MCLYTSAYLQLSLITVVLLPSFETEFICGNRGIWLQEHCIQADCIQTGRSFFLTSVVSKETSEEVAARYLQLSPMYTVHNHTD